MSQPEDPIAVKLELLERGTAAARRFIEGERDAAMSPSPEARAALDAFDAISLDDPISATEAIDLLDSVGSPAAMRQSSGRYYGFVNGGVDPAGLAAAAISGAWDQNLALPTMSPVGSRIDQAAAAMVVDALRLPSSAIASFCGGATIANLTGVITARDTLLARQGWDVDAQGLAGAPPLSVVTSAEAHSSVVKVLRLAGIGSNAVHQVPTDDCGRLIATEMPDLDQPTLLLLQAGNVNTGHSDPFAEIFDGFGRTEPTVPGSASETDHVWVHVDGAFGLWANAAPNRRGQLAGIERADSWATDGHKWLNSPYDAGVVIVADPERLRRSMTTTAAYLPTDNDERSLMNLGLQMSQGARAVPIWAILASLGRDGVAEAVERCCVVAEHFAARLGDAGGEVLAPVVLNQALISFGSDAKTDAVVTAVQADRTCWVGPTEWHGRRAMRVSVSDTSTTIADADRSIDAILACWEQLPG